MKRWLTKLWRKFRPQPKGHYVLTLTEEEVADGTIIVFGGGIVKHPVPTESHVLVGTCSSETVPADEGLPHP
jgi:hypothetical protein